MATTGDTLAISTPCIAPEFYVDPMVTLPSYDWVVTNKSWPDLFSIGTGEPPSIYTDPLPKPMYDLNDDGEFPNLPGIDRRLQEAMEKAWKTVVEDLLDDPLFKAPSAAETGREFLLARAYAALDMAERVLSISGYYDKKPVLPEPVIIDPEPERIAKNLLNIGDPFARQLGTMQFVNQWSDIEEAD